MLSFSSQYFHFPLFLSHTFLSGQHSHSHSHYHSFTEIKIKCLYTIFIGFLLLALIIPKLQGTCTFLFIWLHVAITNGCAVAARLFVTMWKNIEHNFWTQHEWQVVCQTTHRDNAWQNVICSLTFLIIRCHTILIYCISFEIIKCDTCKLKELKSKTRELKVWLKIGLNWSHMVSNHLLI